MSGVNLQGSCQKELVFQQLLGQFHDSTEIADCLTHQLALLRWNNSNVFKSKIVIVLPLLLAAKFFWPKRFQGNECLYFSLRLSLFIGYERWGIYDKKLGEECILGLEGQIFYSREA